jgi:hypothetical protein
MFFGTPHFGTDSASWAKAILNIGSVFSSFNTSVIRHLKTNSEWLRQQLQEFAPRSKDLIIEYYFETLKTPVALGKSKMVADATLYLSF